MASSCAASPTRTSRKPRTPNGVQGARYTQTFTATGGHVTGLVWTLPGAPATAEADKWCFEATLSRRVRGRAGTLNYTCVATRYRRTIHATPVRTTSTIFPRRCPSPRPAWHPASECPLQQRTLGAGGGSAGLQMELVSGVCRPGLDSTLARCCLGNTAQAGPPVADCQGPRQRRELRHPAGNHHDHYSRNHPGWPSAPARLVNS